MQSLNLFQDADSDGQILKTLTQINTTEGKHIMYLDTNNFYDYAISKFIPRCGFRWVDPKNFDSNKYSSNSPKTCFRN